MKKQKWQLKYIADRDDMHIIGIDRGERNLVNDMEFMEKIRDIGGVEDVTLIQYNGEYHG